MLKYRIIVKDNSGTSLGEFEKFFNLTFNKRLNNFGICTFDILSTDTKANSLVSLRRYQVFIYRVEDGTSVLVWAGEQVLRSGDLDRNGKGIVTIQCFDWLEQLKDRYTAATKVFSAIDAGDIAWELIDDTQIQVNGDFGITEGAIIATQDRDRSYFNQNVMEAIINLSDVLSGFDFEITNEKVFKVYSTKGVDKTDSVVFEYGQNIESARIIEDFVNPVNRAIILGESSDNTSDLQRVERENEDSQDLYKIRETLDSQMDISEIETFQEKGDALLQKFQERLFDVDMNLSKGSSPNITDFSLGDTIHLKIVSGVYNVDEDYRVFEWTVVFDNQGAEKLSLVLGRFTL